MYGSHASSTQPERSAMRSRKNASVELSRDVHDLLAAKAKETGLSKKALLEAAVERHLADTRPHVVQQAERHLWQAIDFLAHHPGILCAMTLR